MAVGCKVVPKGGGGGGEIISQIPKTRAEREADAGTVKEFSVWGIIHTTPTRQLGQAFLALRRAPPVIGAALYLLLSPVNRSAAMIGKRIDQGAVF